MKQCPLGQVEGKSVEASRLNCHRVSRLAGWQVGRLEFTGPHETRDSTDMTNSADGAKWKVSAHVPAGSHRSRKAYSCAMGCKSSTGCSWGGAGLDVGGRRNASTALAGLARVELWGGWEMANVCSLMIRR